MNAGGCTFSIEVRRADRTLVGVSDASLTSCIEDAWLWGVRSGRLPNGGGLPELRVEPTWHDAQRPVVTGLSVSLGGSAPRHYRRGVAGSQARSFIRRLVDEGQLASQEKVTWSLVAHEREDADATSSVRTERAPFPLESASLPHVDAGGFEVAVDAGVLLRLSDRIRSSGTVEGAELLVGDLLHDPGHDALELRVVDALRLEPGRGGSSNIHFSFDPAATAAMRRRALDRADGARPVGWHHNHNPCAGCWEQPDCKVDWVFFSAADLEVHSTLFASPHMVALVGGKRGELPGRRPGFRLYGWRDGQVVERTFRVFGNGADDWDPARSGFRDDATAPHAAPPRTAPGESR